MLSHGAHHQRTHIGRSSFGAGIVCLMFLLSGRTLAAERQVTLLVHGIKVHLHAPLDVWGAAPSSSTARQSPGTGMIGHLEHAGHRYGGVLRMQGSRLITEDIDASANLFALEFSAGANVDGLAYKVLELAHGLQELRRLTGCGKVNIVAHSAGGLVARAYLQSALPGVAYAGDVDRLITISTPHLGSVLAEHLGDFLGTRATALRPGGELVRRLNDDLQLPNDVLCASIVVRGIGTSIAAVDTTSAVYDRNLDREFLARLPIDFRSGGDQVVDVRSQNLRLARCAARYEADSGKPVLYLLARVEDPTPRDRSFADRTVHEAAAGDPWTCLWVEMLLATRRCWSPLEDPLRSRWLELQASLVAFGIIEQQVATAHPFSEVTRTTVNRMTLLEQRELRRQFLFVGQGQARPKFLAAALPDMRVTGLVDLQFDRFGRIVSERHATESTTSGR